MQHIENDYFEFQILLSEKNKEAIRAANKNLCLFVCESLLDRTNIGYKSHSIINFIFGGRYTDEKDRKNVRSCIEHLIDGGYITKKSINEVPEYMLTENGRTYTKKVVIARTELNKKEFKNIAEELNKNNIPKNTNNSIYIKILLYLRDEKSYVMRKKPEIAKHIGMPAKVITEDLEFLVKEKYIEKSEKKEKRLYFYNLTSTGEKLIEPIQIPKRKKRFVRSSTYY